MATCERCRQTRLVRGKRSTFPGVCLYCYRSVCGTVATNNKRAKKHGTFGRLRAHDWLCVLSSHRFCCASCGREHKNTPKKKGDYLTLDHILPLSRGGLNTVHNIQPLCGECHTLKDGDPDLLPWERDQVLEQRQRKARAQNFFHNLMATFAGQHNPNFFPEIKREHERRVAEEQETLDFGEFLIETFLMLYIEKNNRSNKHE